MTALAVLATALTLVGAEPAALPEGVEVQWTGAPGCPDVADARARIAKRLENREGPVRASVVIALVSNADGGYGLSLDVELGDETVHRELESSDCEVLLEATAVVVSIAIEPGIPVETLHTVELIEEAAAVPEAPPPSAPDAEPVEVPEPTVVPEPARETEASLPAAAPRRRYPLGGVVRLHGGVGVGVLPGFSGSAGVRLGLLGPHWRIEAGADRTFRTEETFSGEPDVGADFTLWSGTVRGCYVLVHRQLELPLCGGGSAGVMRADGFGGTRNRQVRSGWVAAVLAPGLVWRVHANVGVGASVDGFVALWRPSFNGEARPDLYTPAPIAARALGFVEFRWGS